MFSNGPSLTEEKEKEREKTYISVAKAILVLCIYRDRRVEWQSRWHEPLFRRLATL